MNDENYSKMLECYNSHKAGILENLFSALELKSRGIIDEYGHGQILKHGLSYYICYKFPSNESVKLEHEIHHLEEESFGWINNFGLKNLLKTKLD